MKKAQIEYIGMRNCHYCYRIFNDIDEQIRMFEKHLSIRAKEAAIKEFNRRYYQNKYLIVASGVDELEFIVGVWNNVHEMSVLTGISRNSIASTLCRKKKVTIKILGVKCKLELIPVYGTSNTKKEK